MNAPQAAPAWRFRFSLGTLVWTTALVAVLLGWRIDRAAQKRAWNEQRKILDETRGELVGTADSLRKSMSLIQVRDELVGQYRNQLERTTREVEELHVRNVTQLDLVKRELARLRTSQVNAERQLRNLAQSEKFLAFARTEAAKEFEDLPALAQFLEWSEADEASFLILRRSEQRFVVESARELKKGGDFNAEQITLWQAQPLLSKGLEKAQARK